MPGKFFNSHNHLFNILIDMKPVKANKKEQRKFDIN